MSKIENIAKPTWRWLFTVPFGFMTVYNLYRQEINPKLPPLITFLRNWQWTTWFLLLLLVSALILIEGLVRDKNDAQKNLRTYSSVKSESQSGGVTAGTIGAVNISNLPQNDKKQEQPQKPTVNWDSVEFLPWNPILSERAKCGIEVFNNKEQSIDDCSAELVEIYEEMEGQYIPCYGERKAELPCMLAWEISNEAVYEKIEIERSKHRYVGITYPDGWSSVGGYNQTYYVIRGKNFKYAWPNSRTVIAEIELSCKVNRESPIPKRIFAKILRQHDKFTVTEITNEPPKAFKQA
jgi:hypothetical protein